MSFYPQNAEQNPFPSFNLRAILKATQEFTFSGSLSHSLFSGSLVAPVSFLVQPLDCISLESVCDESLKLILTSELVGIGKKALAVVIVSLYDETEKDYESNLIMSSFHVHKLLLIPVCLVSPRLYLNLTLN
ncbi:hypothetical protein VNO78_07415 [Psophocarpus tetragonolobus]|uniref:Uncharacterized protein n=1 Tax=Psophocarpus tetragonolobus TaxID=3891 RepID=A0AAN9XRW6_PSOTE